MKKHATEIKKQMQSNDEMKRQYSRIKEEEARKIKEQHESQRLFLEKIKQDKIRELRELEVPDKYIVELENKKIS